MKLTVKQLRRLVAEAVSNEKGKTLSEQYEREILGPEIYRIGGDDLLSFAEVYAGLEPIEKDALAALMSNSGEVQFPVDVMEDLGHSISGYNQDIDDALDDWHESSEMAPQVEEADDSASPKEDEKKSEATKGTTPTMTPDQLANYNANRAKKAEIKAREKKYGKGMAGQRARGREWDEK